MTGFLDTLRPIWELAQGGLLNPASNPTAALLALAGAIVILLIILLLIAIPIVIVSRRGADLEELEEGDEEFLAEHAARRARGRRRGALLTLAVLLVLGALAAAGLGYTSADTFCAKCHYTKRAFQSHAKGVHSQVNCRACHEAGGLSTYIDAKARGLNNATGQRARQPRKGPVPSVVANGACLGCHQNVTDGVLVARSIRVRHSDILAAGYRCTDCHNTEGHGKDVVRPQYPEMRYCTVCHDGSKAPATCATCHPKDPGKATRTPRRAIPRATVLKDDCRGCHSMQPCIDCHGIELPHSRKFVAGYHAKYAFNNLDMCLSCHDMYEFCNNRRCHDFAVQTIVSKDGLKRVGWQHGAEFRVTHTKSTAQTCYGCHGNIDMCRYCHGDVPDH